MALLSARACRPGLVPLLVLCAGLMLATQGRAQPQSPQSELKAAFLYNFMLYTDWPADVGRTLNLCLHGTDQWGPAMDLLHGRLVGERVVVLQRKRNALEDCQVVFMTDPGHPLATRLLEELKSRPVLTVGGSPGAARLGVMLNMVSNRDKIAFEVNLPAARAARIKFSSKLLQLSKEVIQ